MTSSFYTPRLRAERVIAGGRVVLGVSSLIAVWADPSEPTNFAGIAYGLLVAYVAYATLTASWLWRVDAVRAPWPAITHGLDLVFFSLFTFFTLGASPFTAYFVFALISATLRWRLPGVFWTGLVTIASFLGLGFYFSAVLQYPPFELDDFLIRAVYMVVIAVLLGYLGAHEERTLRETWQLASWPHFVAKDVRSLAADLLAYAGPLMEAPRAVLVWAEAEAPWRQVATWQAGTTAHDRLAAGPPLVAADIGDRPFIRTTGPRRRTLVQETGGPQVREWTGDAIAGDLAERTGDGHLLSVPVRGQGFEGRLFFVDGADATLDDLLLAEVVAGFVAARLDAFYLTEQLRQAAASEERIRLSRDLHDGVLQSFTGLALRLAAVQKLLQHDRAAALAAVEELRRLLASEQRDFRFFIQELKPPMWPAGPDATLESRLQDLSARMEREWDLRVDLRVEAPAGLPAALARDVYLIVREGLINAARHGSATAARVEIRAFTPDQVTLSVADNGRGFTFTGTYSAEELARLGIGPKTLRERVLAMQGSLTVQSGPGGAELQVTLPATAA